MIRGFKDNKTTTAEEYLIDYGLRTGNHADVNYDLLNMSIKFDGNEIDAFILDVIDDKLILQLVLPIKEKFDNTSNVYKTSHIRNLINSDKFLSRFNNEFIEHIKPTIVHTEDYTTEDKLWLLSHEEVNQPISFLKKNNDCNSYDLFKNVDMKSYSRTLLNLNKQRYSAWWLRSAYSYTDTEDYSSFVGCVDYSGGVDYNYAFYTDYGALLPACTIR